MDLKTFISIIWRRKWVIGITAGLTVLITTLGLSLITPTYAASTTLRIGTATGGSTDYISYDIQYTDRLMNTYKTIVTSDRTATEVMNELGLTEPVKLSVSIPANTELMHVSAAHENPATAAAAANAASQILITEAAQLNEPSGRSSQEILAGQIEDLEQEIAEARARLDELAGQTPPDEAAITAAEESIARKEQTYSSLLAQYDRARFSESLRANLVSVVQPAVEPTSPASPRKSLMIPLGLIIGLVGGLGLAFLFENLDTTLYATTQIERLSEAPVIARIPSERGSRQTGLFGPKTPQEEAFRRLRTNLHALDLERSLRTLLITSSEPGEGKSTTVANLAVTIAQAGRQVVVVDADLRKPAVHQAFQLPNTIGLTELLAGDATLEEVLQFAMIPGVQVITSGRATPNPAELLGLDRMRQLIDELLTRFDLVLFDTPSLQTVTDAGVLAPIVDGVLLVVARGQARQESVRAAMQQLANVRVKPVGVIVNRAEQSGMFHYDRPAAEKPIDPARQPMPVLADMEDDVKPEPEIIERLQNVTKFESRRTRAVVVPGGVPIRARARTTTEPVVLRRLRVDPSSGEKGEESPWLTNREQAAGER